LFRKGFLASVREFARIVSSAFGGLAARFGRQVASTRERRVGLREGGGRAPIS